MACFSESYVGPATPTISAPQAATFDVMNPCYFDQQQGHGERFEAGQPETFQYSSILYDASTDPQAIFNDGNEDAQVPGEGSSPMNDPKDYEALLRNFHGVTVDDNSGTNQIENLSNDSRNQVNTNQTSIPNQLMGNQYEQNYDYRQYGYNPEHQPEISQANCNYQYSYQPQGDALANSFYGPKPYGGPTGNGEGDRHFLHPYIHQLPVIFHPFITQVQDVEHDGNCGFRAVATCLGFPKNQWLTIRYNLMEELKSHEMEYTKMFGSQEWYNKVYNSLNFFKSDSAPVEHWMTMPEMGFLIASRYNVILHVLSMTGSTTYLPLRSSPPPWHEHVAIALGYVNNNHYVKVTLTRGYPIPTVAPQWNYFRYDCAYAWITPYEHRINSYNEYVDSNCTREHVILE
ncbi:uncharacterized protein LOC116000234 [Ipomoea triloba]|uniref:uncharacterized protein LOC116000234 n=1 Tax=Ipomoea triloba TaxID=35885 RepID=UPI00125D53E6|nr:uncharacterized protein LOC116000234 [Ipomoea triloba]